MLQHVSVRNVFQVVVVFARRGDVDRRLDAVAVERLAAGVHHVSARPQSSSSTAGPVRDTASPRSTSPSAMLLHVVGLVGGPDADLHLLRVGRFELKPDAAVFVRSLGIRPGDAWCWRAETRRDPVAAPSTGR